MLAATTHGIAVVLATRPLGKAHLATSKEDPVTTRGVVYIHAAPPALCPHVEWAVGGVLGMRVTLEWTPQPTAPGTFRAELSWQADPGTASKLASALRDWMHLRFEVTEEPSAGAEGERYSSTPRWACSTRRPACTATSWCARTGCAQRSPARRPTRRPA